jgi:hypothetical protein
MSLYVDAERAAKSKLPLWQTISLSYSTYFVHFMDVLRISWLWLLVVAVLVGISISLNLSWLAEVVANSKPGMPLQISAKPIKTIVFEDGSAVILFLAGVSIAVAWHRRLLLEEHRGFSGSNLVAGSLWRYAGMCIAICLIFVVPGLVIAVPTFVWVIPDMTDVPSANPSIIRVIILMLVAVEFAAAAVILRLSLLLPARAVGDRHLTFKETWSRTRGNTWRIFWGILACTLPPICLLQIGLFLNLEILVGVQIIRPAVIINVILTIYYLLILPIWIGFLSHAYRHFFRRV